MGRLDGKIAIITGGASGIGAATAMKFGSEGATVIVTDIQDDKGQDVAGSITNAGGKAVYMNHDVTDEAAWERVVKDTVDQFGGVHILFNNAGFAVPGSTFDMTLEDWRRQMAVNLDGVFLGAKHTVPAMATSGGGSMIITSSIAGLKGSPNLSAYSASKGAVRLFSKSVARECAARGDNVRVNSIHPGIIETPIWAQMSENGDPQPVIDQLAANASTNIPLGRLGTAEDIANTVLFLASDESDYITGQEFVIDGGMTS